MMKTRISLIVSACILFSSASAFALPGASIGLMGGANLAVPSLSTPGFSSSGSIGYSVGPTVQAGPLEVSALYTHYTVKLTPTGGTAVSSSSKYLDIPALYRLGVGLASVGVGGFYGIALDSGNSANYGAVASARVSIPGGYFLDGRFNLGLKDVSGSKLSAASVLLGFNFL
jgi:hypothetical protein